jgi:hypothetical protein
LDARAIASLDQEARHALPAELQRYRQPDRAAAADKDRDVHGLQYRVEERTSATRRSMTMPLPWRLFRPHLATLRSGN